MKFIVCKSPDRCQWPLGLELTLRQTAELLEVNAALMAYHCRTALAILHQGFYIDIVREENEDDSLPGLD